MSSLELSTTLVAGSFFVVIIGSGIRYFHPAAEEEYMPKNYLEL